MTSPPSPAFSEILSSCCSSTEGLDCNGSHSEASSPELKRAKRQNMKTRLEGILISRLPPISTTRTAEDGPNASQISFTSVDNDRGHDFKDSPRSRSGLGDAQNLCCSLPDMNLDAANECKGLDVDCNCRSHSVSEPTEISLELRRDRKDKVVSSYYSHFKQIHSTPLLQNMGSKVESDSEGETKVNEQEPIISNNAETSDVLYWRNNVISSENRDSVAVILNDDGPFAPKSKHTIETGVSTDGRVSPNMVAKGDQRDGDIVEMPAVSNVDEENRRSGVEIVSLDGAVSLGENITAEDFTTLLPAQSSPKCTESTGQMMGTTQKTPTVDSNAPAGESAANIETLSPIEPVCGNSKVSPAGESSPMTLNESGRIYENPSAENLYSEILGHSKHLENGLETSRDSKNDTGQSLGSRCIEKEFKSELEFSTVLTLAYVRVRDLTNSIDKAQEYLAKMNKNGILHMHSSIGRSPNDEDDLIELRYKIQAMFDSRAALSLEQSKWRSQFSTHYQQRKRALASLKLRASRTEQTYFQLRKELLDLEKEPIIPKRKRSLFSKLFSFRFVK